MLITFATEDMGDTPKSPCFVKATPIPAKNKHKIKTIYLLEYFFLAHPCGTLRKEGVFCISIIMIVLLLTVQPYWVCRFQL